jgi:hypothetical protein
MILSTVCLEEKLEENDFYLMKQKEISTKQPDKQSEEMHRMFELLPASRSRSTRAQRRLE